MSAPSRNDPCPCGSGKKYKKCCLGRDTATHAGHPNALNHPASGRNQVGVEFGGSAAPSNPLMHYSKLGNTYLAQGKLDAAIGSFRMALALDPDFAEVHCNMGLALQSQGNLHAAIKSYRKALALRPDLAAVHTNLGLVRQAQGDLDAAVASHRRAVALQPDFADAHYNLGIALKQQGKLDEAVASYRRALSHNPDHAEAYGSLGNALQQQGKPDDALACFQHQVRLTPGNGVAQHHIASLTGKNTERAPVQYIEQVFDDYADTFDAHLVQVLKYDVPDKLVELVNRHLTPAAEKWNVLDLGCGTGLVGSAIAPCARQLVGVDVSARMLEKARARNVYQRLERLDLLTMMRSEQASSYDVIIAADVFIYLGKLDEIISEIKRLLCPGGVFAFSVEAHAALVNEEAMQGVQPDYQLGHTRRYSHSTDYIARLAAANGFSIQEMAAAQLRLEQSIPINGHLVLWLA